MHGVLLLDKPKGLSSNDVLQKCKWLLRAEKAGRVKTINAAPGDSLAVDAVILEFE